MGRKMLRSTTAPKSATAQKNTAAHRRIKSKLEQREAEPPIAPLALSIRQFCIAHDLSIDKFYLMNREGAGPATMRCDGRTLISIEAASAWRREREIAGKIRAHPDMSDSDIATDMIGVSETTVSRARKKFAAQEQQKQRRQERQKQRQHKQAAEAAATTA